MGGGEGGALSRGIVVHVCFLVIVSGQVIWWLLVSSNEHSIVYLESITRLLLAMFF